MLVELHVHTQASDGELSPRQTVEYLVKERQISAVAITDHNTTNALLEAAETAKRMGVYFIPGFESSVRCSKMDIPLLHILGYFSEASVPMEDEWFQGVFEGIRASTIERLEAMCKDSQDNPLTINGQEISLHMEEICRDKKNIAGTTSFLKLFIRKVEEATGYTLPVFDLRNLLLDDEEVYRKHQRFLKLHAGLIPAIQKWYRPRVASLFPEAEEVISRIRQLGGVSVLAHPYEGVKTKEKGKEPITEEWFRGLISYGLSGVEVYSPNGTAEEMDNFNRWAKEHNLIITGSTDFHGPNISQGRRPGYYKWNRPVPEKCFQDLWKAIKPPK